MYNQGQGCSLMVECLLNVGTAPHSIPNVGIPITQLIINHDFRHSILIH